MTTDGQIHHLKGVQAWRFSDRILRAYSPDPMGNCITVEIATTVEFHGHKWWDAVQSFDLKDVKAIGGGLAEHPEFFTRTWGDVVLTPAS